MKQTEREKRLKKSLDRVTEQLIRAMARAERKGYTGMRGSRGAYLDEAIVRSLTRKRDRILGEMLRESRKARRSGRDPGKGASREFYETNRKIRGAAMRLGWSVVPDENVVPLGGGVFQVAVYDRRSRTGKKVVRIRIPAWMYQD